MKAKTYEEVRNALGYNQEQMANELGISRRSYQMHEQGDYPVFLDELIKMCALNNKNPLKIETKKGTFEISIKQE